MTETMRSWRPGFGEVRWFPYAGLREDEKKSARDFAWEYVKTRSQSRIAAMEFGLAGNRIVAVRAVGAIRAGDEEADPIEDEREDEDAVVCEDCGEGVDPEDAATCRICDDTFCEPCQGRHEFNCERWEDA